MKCIVLAVLFLNPFKNIGTRANITKSYCGLDKTGASVVYEGESTIGTYPWMGMLYYPIGKTRFTTSVVLVTRQLVIASATEIEQIPKRDFREITRVVLGYKCGENEIPVRDYTYHPEFNNDRYSALALVQLNVDDVKIELRPICQPPNYFFEPQFYAFTMPEGCKNPRLRIHKMNYVNINECKDFYRRTGLSQEKMWPTHTACARAESGGECVWRSGSVLAVKQNGRWRLLGFSVHGPGCGAPARFLDYGMYHHWIRRAVITQGRPAITKIADNHLVLRRSTANIQRFGQCDYEETRESLYSDRVTIFYQSGLFRSSYNVSIYGSVEYSCVMFKVRPLRKKADYEPYDIDPFLMGYMNPTVYGNPYPKIRLRRWCGKPTRMCYGYQNLEIQFYVEIYFSETVEFAMRAFGKRIKQIVPHAVLRWSNRNFGTYADIPNYLSILDLLIKNKTELSEKQVAAWFF